MKHLLLMIIFIISFPLSAQSDSELDLGNVVIQGESSNLTDSVSYQRDFAFYNTINSEKELDFEPQFQPFSIPMQILNPGSKLAVQALGGNSTTRINAAYSKNRIFNFAGEYNLNKINKNWSQSNFSISWQPQYKGYDWAFMFNDFTSKDSIDQTNLLSYDFTISTPSYSIENMIPFEFDIAFILTYLASEQRDNKENDLNLSTTITARSEAFNSHINAEYLNQSFSGYSSLGLNKMMFGYPQIWFGYDEIHFYPSVSFDRSFKIFKGVEIQLANLPQILNQDLRASFRENFFQSLKYNNLQEKKQLNAFVALQNDNILPLSFYYNPQFIKDKRMYETSLSGYYIQIVKDRFIHTFGADLTWRLKEFDIDNSLRYQYFEKEIYFEPKLQLINSISRQYGSFFGKLEMNFLADRTDDLGNEMDDYFQININVEYKFKENFAFFGYAENLLNSDYIQYRNIPKEGINLYIGCRYGF